MIMLVENDIYELPIAVEDTVSNMFRLLNKTGLSSISRSGIDSSLKRNTVTKLSDGRFGKFIRVEEEE